jgi:hypothetical protein
MLNVKFQPDKIKNNEENAILQFWLFGVHFFKSHHVPYFHIAILECKENRKITVFANLINSSNIPLFSVFWSVFSFCLTQLIAFGGWMHCCDLSLSFQKDVGLIFCSEIID